MSQQFEDFPLSKTLVCERPKYLTVRSRTGLHCSLSKSVVSPFETVSPTDLCQTWFKVIHDYSNRSLSMPNDKLPAVSAIARWIFGGSGNNYLAGLPNTALHAGLAWMSYTASGQKHPVPVYRAPSWSWASTDYPVSFVTIQNIPRLRDNTDFEARDRRYDLLAEQNRMELHSTQVKLDGIDPFGRVISGSIKLRARTKIGHVVQHSSWIEDPTSGEKVARFFPDDPFWYSYANPTTDNQEVAAERSDIQGIFKPPSTEPSSFVPKKIKCLCINYHVNWTLTALAIEELSPIQTESSTSPGTYKAYRRIGLLWCGRVNDPDIEWFKDSAWELIELFSLGILLVFPNALSSCI